MGNRESKKEEIVVQAAGTGNNQSTQTQDFSRSEWLLLGILAVLVLAEDWYLFNRLAKHRRLMVQRELRKSALNLSQP